MDTLSVNQQVPNKKLGLFALIGLVVITLLAGGVYYFGYAGANEAPPRLGGAAGQGLQGLTKWEGKKGNALVYEKKDVDEFKKPRSTHTDKPAKIKPVIDPVSKGGIAYFIADQDFTLKAVTGEYTVPKEKMPIVAIAYDPSTKLFLTTEQTFTEWKNNTKISSDREIKQGEGFIIANDGQEFESYATPASQEPSVDTDLSAIAHAGWNLIGLTKSQLKTLNDDYTNVWSVWAFNAKGETEKLDLSNVDTSKLTSYLFWVKFDGTPEKKSETKTTDRNTTTDRTGTTTDRNTTQRGQTATDRGTDSSVANDEETTSDENLRLISTTPGNEKVTIVMSAQNLKVNPTGIAIKYDGKTYEKTAANLSDSTKDGIVITNESDVQTIVISKLTNDKEYTFDISLIYKAGAYPNPKHLVTDAVTPKATEQAQEQGQGKGAGSDTGLVSDKVTLAAVLEADNSTATLMFTRTEVPAQYKDKFKGLFVSYTSNASPDALEAELLAKADSKVTGGYTYAQDSVKTGVKNNPDVTFDEKTDRIKVSNLKSGSTYRFILNSEYLEADGINTSIGDYSDPAELITPSEAVKDTLSAGDTNAKSDAISIIDTKWTTTNEDKFKGLQVSYGKSADDVKDYTTEFITLSAPHHGKISYMKDPHQSLTISGLDSDTEYKVILKLAYNDGFQSSTKEITITKKTTAQNAVTNVTLSANNPPAMVVQQGEKNVLFSSFEFIPTKDVTMTGITIERGGVGLSSDFKSVKIYLADKLLYTIDNPSLDLNPILGLQINTPQKLSANGKVTINVKADISDTAQTGNIQLLKLKQLQFENTDGSKFSVETDVSGNSMSIVEGSVPFAVTTDSGEYKKIADVKVWDIATYSTFYFANFLPDKIHITSVKFTSTQGNICPYTGTNIQISMSGDKDAMKTVGCDTNNSELTFTGDYLMDATQVVQATPSFDLSNMGEGQKLQLGVSEIKYNKDGDATTNILDLSNTPVNGKILNITAASASIDYGFASLFDSLLDSLFNLFK